MLRYSSNHYPCLGRVAWFAWSECHPTYWPLHAVDTWPVQIVKINSLYCEHAHWQIVNPVNAGIDFKRQNMTHRRQILTFIVDPRTGKIMKQKELTKPFTMILN